MEIKGTKKARTKKRKASKDGVKHPMKRTGEHSEPEKESPKGPAVNELPKNRKRSESQVILDRAEMVNLMRRGYTQAAIAERLQLSPAQIAYDWKAALKQLLAQQTDDTKACVAIAVEQYGLIQQEAWREWEKSKKGGVKRGRKTTQNHNGRGSEEESTEVTEGRGDPRYLRVVMDCIAHIRELKGLDAPKELNINGTLTWDVFSGVLEHEPTDEEVDEIEGLIRKALTDRGPETEGRLQGGGGDTEIIDTEVVSIKDR